MLKQEIIEKIKTNAPLKLELMQENKKSQYTIERWLKQNNKKLSEFANLSIIGNHLSVSNINQLLQ